MRDGCQPMLLERRPACEGCRCGRCKASTVAGPAVTVQALLSCLGALGQDGGWEATCIVSCSFKMWGLPATCSTLGPCWVVLPRAPKQASPVPELAQHITTAGTQQPAQLAEQCHIRAGRTHCLVGCGVEAKFAVPCSQVHGPVVAEGVDASHSCSAWAVGRTECSLGQQEWAAVNRECRCLKAVC